MEPRGQEDATPAETGDVSPAQADTGDLATAAGDAYVQVPTSEDEVSPAASGGNGEWVKQWDERVGEFYFSNIHTRATSWEQPPDYVDTTAGTASGDRKKRHEEADDVDEQDSQDECDGGMRIINSHDVASVKTQRVYRGHSPRNKLEVQQQWIKQFDPSSQQVYYYNIGTSESQWDQPDDFVEGVQDAKTEGVVKIQSLYRSKKARDQVKDRMVESNGGESGSVVDEVDSGDVQLEGGRMSDNDNNGKGSRHEAALSIQCAFRKHSAVKTAESKRGDLRDLTCTDTINQKIGDLMRAMDEIQLEINARQLVSAAEMEEFPHLCELVASWTNSFDALKDRILGLPYQADQIQKMEVTSEKTANAKHLHESLAETRSECLSLLRSIFLMNTYFVDLDVKRINGANATFRKWKSHELCALADPRIVKIVQPDDLQDVFTLVERTLRRAMGLTDFTSGATTAAGKRYEEWHIEVIAALESVTQMEQRLQHKIHLLHMFRAGQAERKEVALMEIEDFTSSQREAVSKERARQADKYAKFLEECRGSWESGLEKRLDDAQEAIAHEKAEHEALTRKLEIVEKMRKRDHHRRATMKLSIWEAVREGLPVEILRTMVFAEMQKARRLGYDFLLRSARSDHGESLIQIACWWGHEIRILLQHGLKHDVIDSSGDTPLHWAARRNHYEAVHTLLGAHAPCAEQKTLEAILKTVRTKNHRGKTPHQVSRSECIRRLIQAFDDGRLPLFRHPRAKPAESHRRMTDFTPHRSASTSSTGDGKSFARTLSSKSFSSTAHGMSVQVPEDGFGITDVLTPRSPEHRNRKQSSSSKSSK